MTKVSGRTVWCVVGLLLALPVITSVEAQEVDLIPMDVTVLWGCEAELNGNLECSGRGGTEGAKKLLWTEGWDDLDEYFVWKVNVPEEDDYRVAISYSCLGASGSQFEIVAGDSKVTGTVRKTDPWLPQDWGALYTSFEEKQLDGTLHLPKGSATITLRATEKADTGDVMNLYTVELTPLAATNVVASARERARKTRASTDWFVDAKYGVAFHWRRSVRNHGEAIRSPSATPYAIST